MSQINKENVNENIAHLKTKLSHLKTTDDGKIRNENQKIDSNIEHFARFLEIDGLPTNLICSRRQFISELVALFLAANGDLQKCTNIPVRLVLFDDVLVICAFNRVERSQSPLVCLQPNTDTLPRPKKRVSMPSAHLVYGKAYKYLKHFAIEEIKEIGTFSTEENHSAYLFSTNKMNFLLYSSNYSGSAQFIETVQKGREKRAEKAASINQKELAKYFSSDEITSIIKSLKAETDRSKTPEALIKTEETSKKSEKKNKTPNDVLEKNKKRLSTGKYFMIYKESDALREEINNKIVHFTRFLDIENLPSQLICSNRQFIHELDAISVFGTCDFENFREQEIRLVIFTDVVVICEVNRENRSFNFGLHPLAVDTPTRLRKQVSMPALGRGLKKSLKYAKHIELKSFRKIQALGELPSHLSGNKDILVLTIVEDLRESIWLIQTKDHWAVDKALSYIQNYINLTCKRDVHSLIPYPFEYLQLFSNGASLEQYLQKNNSCQTPRR